MMFLRSFIQSHHLTKATRCMYVCLSLNKSKTADPNGLQRISLSSSWSREGFRLKIFRIHPPVRRKSGKNRGEAASLLYNMYLALRFGVRFLCRLKLSCRNCRNSCCSRCDWSIEMDGAWNELENSRTFGRYRRGLARPRCGAFWWRGAQRARQQKTY